MDGTDDAAPAFRRNLRPLFAGLLVNALVAALLLGGPWLRGRLRAQQARAHFTELAACLWGGQPVTRPGLGLPPAEELHFADRVLHAPPDWPADCRTPLGRVAMEPAWLLFPAVRQAEGVVSDAVAKLDGALSAMAYERSQGPATHVDMALHRRVEHLLAALSNLAKVSGVDGHVTDPAIRFDGPPSVVAPTRVPLKVSRHAASHIRVRGDGLVALAMDRRGITRAQVGAGGMTLQRVRRPSLVRGAVMDTDHRPWLVWAMPEERCASDATRCAGRAMGVAQLRKGDTRPPDPTWLTAHPHGDATRTVRVRMGPPGGPVPVDVIARRVEGGAEVRRFLVGEAPGADDGVHHDEDDDGRAGGPPPLGPAVTWSLPGDGAAEHATWLGEGDRVLYATADEQGISLRMRAIDSADSPAQELARARHTPGGAPWIHPCPHRGGAWVAFGAGPRATLVSVDAEGGVQPVHHALTVDDPGALALACDAGRVDVVSVRSDRGALTHRTCTPAGCAAPHTVDAPARHVDAIRDRGTTVVAFADGRRSQVRIITLGGDGEPPTAPKVAAPCFGRDGGFCGPPVLAARNGRILLGARDAGDLLMLETVDGGRTWLPMRGLR
jgi:hypothetical protein